MLRENSYSVEDQRRMSLARNYFAWQARLALPLLGRHVLEIGCGIGNFTGALLDRELVIAVDGDAACTQILRDRFQNRSNLHVVNREIGRGSLCDLRALQPDSCLCLNVLEHIRDDLGALEAMSCVLPSGAPIVLLAPAFPALFGPIDRNLGHFRRYTRRSIIALAEAARLKVRTLRYVNAVGFFGWWVNARVFRLEKQSEVQIRIFDQYLLPLFSHLEQIVKPPFGQSLFAVLEKP